MAGFAATAVGVSITACGGGSDKTANTDFDDTGTVGILHSLSGTMAISESTLVDTEKMAIEEINAAGGVEVDGKKYKIDYIVEDGASDWPTFAEKSKKLIDQDSVPVVFGGWTSASRKAMLPVYESKDANDPIIPNFQYTNLLGTLDIDEVITGDTSGSRARIVSTTSNYIYFIPIEDDKFTDGETITGPNATLKIVLGSVNGGSKDITSDFDLDNGQRDQFYDYSTIVRKAGFAAPSHKLLVIFDRFLTTAGINPYTVDSYATADYKIIPKYDGDPLRDYIDFRPIVPEKLTGSGSQASPWTLSATKQLDFDARAFTGNMSGLPGIGDTTILSLQHYLGRIDKVFMNKDSFIQVIKGAPAVRAQAPEDTEDAMLLATVRYAPYVFDVDDDITIEETNFKRYTFRDIQVLEDRIKTLEYYTQLSLLESETASMEIRDTSGLSRFKNGFIVDNFASLSTSDTLHPDYRVSLDFERGQMRPAHYTTQVPLTYAGSSTNVQQTDDIITLPYSSTVLIDQPYASAVENVNPFNVFTYTGDIQLYPESDNWVDTT